MITLNRGEHTTFTSANGIEYWVRNRNGKYYVCKTSSYGFEVKATKEIKENIKLA